MNRTAINPWPWSLRLGYNQAECLTGVQRHLICAGQTAVDATGTPQHAGDMRAQLALVLDNVAAVLQAASLSFENIVKISIFTTDVDAALQHFDLLAARLGAAGVAPPMTLLGVTRLALPSLLIEIEVTAAD